jgi:hypothetical protein
LKFEQGIKEYSNYDEIEGMYAASHFGSRLHEKELDQFTEMLDGGEI